MVTNFYLIDILLKMTVLKDNQKSHSINEENILKLNTIRVKNDLKMHVNP